MTTNSVEAPALVEATARETTAEAPTMETAMETTRMKIMLMEKCKPDSNGNTVGIIGQ